MTDVQSLRVCDVLGNSGEEDRETSLAHVLPPHGARTRVQYYRPQPSLGDLFHGWMAPPFPNTPTLPSELSLSGLFRYKSVVCIHIPVEHRRDILLVPLMCKML